MFGLLMGTLQKFKQESNVSSEKVRTLIQFDIEQLSSLNLIDKASKQSSKANV